MFLLLTRVSWLVTKHEHSTLSLIIFSSEQYPVAMGGQELIRKPVVEEVFKSYVKYTPLQVKVQRKEAAKCS